MAAVNERILFSLIESVCAIMYAHEELPTVCWAELKSKAAYVFNRNGYTPADGKSPYELCYNKKLFMNNRKSILRYVPKQKRQKHDKKRKNVF